MRSTLRRAERCQQILSERYCAYLKSLTDEEFAAECRRLFAGYTRKQLLTEMREDNDLLEDGHESFNAYLDKLFDGRDRL